MIFGAKIQIAILVLKLPLSLNFRAKNHPTWSLPQLSWVSKVPWQCIEAFDCHETHGKLQMGSFSAGKFKSPFSTRLFFFKEKPIGATLLQLALAPKFVKQTWSGFDFNLSQILSGGS